MDSVMWVAVTVRGGQSESLKGGTFVVSRRYQTGEGTADQEDQVREYWSAECEK
jgi:hypothetical protein